MSIRSKIFVLGISGLTLFASLASAQKGKQEAAMTPDSLNKDTKLQWTRINKVKALKLPVRNGNTKRPLKYQVYTTDPIRLKAFLMELKNRPGHIIVPVTEGDGGVEFAVTNANTMSAALAAKYPQIISLKGTGVPDKNASLRLDYDGNALHAEIVRNGVVYIIAPWKKRSTIYYLLYKKEDSGTERKPLSEPR